MKNADDALEHFASPGVPFRAKSLNVPDQFLEHRLGFWSQVELIADDL